MLCVDGNLWYRLFCLNICRGFFFKSVKKSFWKQVSVAEKDTKLGAWRSGTYLCKNHSFIIFTLCMHLHQSLTFEALWSAPLREDMALKQGWYLQNILRSGGPYLVSEHSILRYWELRHTFDHFLYKLCEYSPSFII